MAQPAKNDLIKKLQQDDERSRLIQSLQNHDLQQKAAAGVLEQIETFARSGLGSASLGVSEPVLSGINALGYAAQERLPAPGPSGSDLGVDEVPREPTSLADLYQQDVTRRRGLQEQAPGADMAGAIAGALAPAGPAAAVFGGASKLAGMIPRASSTMGKIAAGGLGAGLGTLATEIPRKTIGEATGFIQPGEEQASSLEEAGTSVKLGAALSAIPLVGKGLGIAGKRAVTTFLGPREETISRLMSDIKAGKKALPKEQITELAQLAATSIKEEAQRSKLNLVDSIQSGLNKMKAEVLNQSDIATQKLVESGKVFSRDDLKKAIEVAASPLNRDGIVGESAKAAKGKVQALLSDLDTLPKEVDAITLKNIIKSIDNEVEYLTVPGKFQSDLGNKTLTQARRNLDDIIKSAVPEYKTEVGKAYEMSTFLKESADILGGEDKSFKAIGNLINDKMAINNQTTEQFLRKQGFDIERFKQVQEDAKAFNNWDTLSTAEQKVKSLMSDRSDAIKQQFALLSKAPGNDLDFVREIEATGTAHKFEQEFINGSKNVNLWTVLGAGSGAAIGGGMVGAAIGSATGALIDKYGPKIARKILEGVSKIQGLPTIQKIDRALEGVSPEAKQDMINSFVRTVTTGRKENTKTFIEPHMRASLTKELHAAEGLSPSKKAKMITDLNDKGEIDGMQELVLSGKKPQEQQPSTFKNKPDSKPVNRSSVADFVRTKRGTEY